MATEDIDAPTRPYQVERVEVLAETAELKVSVFAFAPGQEIPWHSHSEIDDIFVCLTGRLRIEARDPAETVSLAPGERHTMAAGRAHRVSGGDDGRCEYLIVQVIGMNTDHTLEEVGQQFSVTRERIRQIEAKALRKLKHPSRSASSAASSIPEGRAAPAAMATEDIGAPTRLYQVERVEVLAETRDLRVSLLAFAPGQEVPWHTHTEVEDIFVCLAGRLRIEARDPAETVSLAPGERHTMPAGRAHRVSGDDGRYEYLIVQGVGRFDFKPVGR